MVKLDKPIQVKKKVERDGKEVELILWERGTPLCPDCGPEAADLLSGVWDDS
jgi:hypothetical protein